MTTLREMLEPLIRVYVKSVTTFKPDMLIETQKKSGGISRVHSQSNALTIFFRGTRETNDKYISADTAMQNTAGCLKDNLHYFGSRNVNPYYESDYLLHNSWHRTYAEKSEVHYHITSNDYIKPITVDEVKCLFGAIKSAEKELGLCRDGNTDCVLTDEDYKKIIQEYTHSLTQVHSKKLVHSNAVNKHVEELYVFLENGTIHAAKVFTQSFLTTLFDNYLTPLLINQGLGRRKAIVICEGLKTTMTYGLSSSLLGASLDIIIRNGLERILIQNGVNGSVASTILSTIGTVLAFTKNPFSLVELLFNGVVAFNGQLMAFGVIHCLPKLKLEPNEENVVRNEELNRIVIASSAENSEPDNRSHVGKRRHRI